MILDVFSRYVVGWTIAPFESAAVAKDLITTTIARQNVRERQLTIHSDRGSVMVSKTYVQLLGDLGVVGSYNRPYRSNDNPYSESHFRTMKYHRTYLSRFGSLEDAQTWAREYFEWNNNEFYHSEIALMHPATAAKRIRCGRFGSASWMPRTPVTPINSEVVSRRSQSPAAGRGSIDPRQSECGTDSKQGR